MTQKYEIKDSGDRRVFGTGSVRDMAEGKGRYDLIPYEAIRRLAVHYEAGAKKYGDHNWQKGQPIHVLVDSMLRHAEKVKAGFEDEDHLAAVMWNAAAIIWTREQIRAGALPEELETVFSDIQKAAFYHPEPQQCENQCTCAGVCGSHPVADGCPDSDVAVLKTLGWALVQGKITREEFGRAKSDVFWATRNLKNLSGFNPEDPDVAGFATWSELPNGADFWVGIARKAST